MSIFKNEVVGYEFLHIYLYSRVIHSTNFSLSFAFLFFSLFVFFWSDFIMFFLLFNENFYYLTYNTSTLLPTYPSSFVPFITSLSLSLPSFYTYSIYLSFSLFLRSFYFSSEIFFLSSTVLLLFLLYWYSKEMD